MMYSLPPMIQKPDPQGLLNEVDQLSMPPPLALSDSGRPYDPIVLMANARYPINERLTCNRVFIPPTPPSPAQSGDSSRPHTPVGADERLAQ